jgi:phage shock protein C
VNPRRLYRSRDRQLAGVAGGMAEYMEIDPTVVRILWIIVGIASGGFALLVYFVLALVIPSTPYLSAAGSGGWAPAGAPAGWPPASASPATGWAPPATPAWGQQAGVAPAPATRSASRGIGAAAIVGVVLIVFGAIALADAALPGWVAGAIIGPAVILALGAALLVSSLRRQEADVTSGSTAFAAGPAAAPQDAPGVATDGSPWDVTDTQPVEPLAEATGPGAQPA